MTVRGFRTKIAIHVVFLLLISALVTDVLVVLVVQGVFVRDRLSRQNEKLAAVGAILLRQAPAAAGAEQMPGMAGMASADDLAVLIVDLDGAPRMLRRHEAFGDDRLRAATSAVLKSGKPLEEHIGLTLAVFWYHPRYVLTAVPVHIEGRLAGAAASVVTLAPIYSKLRRYNKPVFVYIIFNTIILSIVGLYRIFRIYLRPIDRIIRQADDYDQNQDFFFTFRHEDNELNRLSSSLNRMLKRISEDQQKLKETVASLEKANQELIKAQNDVIRAEKLASVGRLAAGIAHEIGNPIGIVMGYLDLLKQADLAREDHDDFLLRAEQEVQRINTIIRKLLDLARPKESASGDMSAHGLIEDMVEVMGHQPMMSDIHFKTRLQAEQDRLWANPEQLRQVLLNLLLNAADAIRAAGRGPDGCITITTALTPDREAEEKQWLTIAVTDNGEGIAPDQLETIFDPFYTTKEPGKGTGLGLAVSYMIVEKMGGTIGARSEAGSGTTMTLRLPLKESEPPLPVVGRRDRR